MKKLLFAICGTGLLFSSCKENDLPVIRPTKAVDTTYTLTSIPAADAHSVLVEEFTGTSCSNCPGGHATLDALSAANGNRVNIISLYIHSGGLSNPGQGAHSIDLRDNVADGIGNTLFGGVNGLPAASIDRVPVSGNVIQYGASNWSGPVNTQLTVTTPVNISVQSVYNDTTNEATISAIVTYTQDVSTAENLSVVIVQDSIIGSQEFPSGFDSNYVFKDVFRAMLSAPPYGDGILPKMAVKSAGRVYLRTYSYKPGTVTPAIVTKNCRVVAFVAAANGTDNHIVQSAQCPLRP